MSDASRSSDTPFSRDVLGRRLCTSFDDAKKSAEERPYDLVILGAGAMGASLAEMLFAGDKDKALRVLVLDAGPFALAEHVQNIPLVDFGAPPPSTIDALRAEGQFGLEHPRNDVWGLPWRSTTPSSGLAYCIGGRSLFWNGWAPVPLHTDTHSELDPSAWPSEVVSDLSERYFDEAAEQIGVTVKNDFLHGELHDALRAALFDALHEKQIRGAVPLAELPEAITVPRTPLAPSASPIESVLFLSTALRERGLSISKVMDLLGLPNRNEHLAVEWVLRNAVQELDLLHLLKLEAPLGIQSRTRTGLFPFNKWSSVPSLLRAASAARREAESSSAPPRLSVVSFCNARRIVFAEGRARAIETNLGTLPLTEGARVVLAMGAIESARLALASLEPTATPREHNIGASLLTHLGSRLVLRIARSALEDLLDPSVHDLQTSALLVRGEHRFDDGRVGHFQFQISAAGLGDPDAESLIDLYRKIPDIDDFEPLKAANDEQVLLVIRGVGEMDAPSGRGSVELDDERDEFGAPRARATLEPSERDNELWSAMDRAMDDIARAFARGRAFEVLSPKGFVEIRPGDELAAVIPHSPIEDGGRRLGLGVLHHEAATLRMHKDPSLAATDEKGELRALPGVYAIGPALLPTVGASDPMLLCLALTRRLAAHLLPHE